MQQAAKFDVRSDGAFEETLGFLQSCLSEGALQRYRCLFEGPAIGTDPVFREAVEEGLGAFLSDLGRWQKSFDAPGDLFEYLTRSLSIGSCSGHYR